MSVRMALAKLCACTCGGALIGAGGAQIADTPPAKVASKHYAKKKVKARKVAYRAPVRKIKRVRKVTRTTTMTACAPSVVTVASQGAPMPPMPYAPPQSMGAIDFGGGGIPIAVNTLPCKQFHIGTFALQAPRPAPFFLLLRAD